MAEYTELVKLPTRGILYKDIPEEFVIKAISTKEEKMIYGSSNEKALDAVIRNCIVEPSKIDVNDLISVDKHFLMMKLRVLTYGNSYHVKYKCPECTNYPTQEFEVDLDDLEVYELSDDYVEPFEFELPTSKKTVGIKLLTGKDLDEIEKKSKRLLKRFPEIKGDPSYILRMAQYLVSVDGDDKIPDVKKQEFIEGLHGNDSAYIWHKINSIKVGYDTTIFDTCKNPRCQADIEFVMPMTVEFFRPRFKD